MNRDGYSAADGGGFRPFSKREVQEGHSARLVSPAGNQQEQGIDLNEQLIKNRSSTYFFRMQGDAMQDAGIFDNDILIVDRSLKLANGRIILCILNGEMLVRRFHKNFSSAFLLPENSRYKNINLSEFSDFSLWGVVTFVIHQV